MQKKDTSQGRERQIKFAEATILFVLLLAVTIFVGVSFRGNQEGLEPTAPIAVETNEATTESNIGNEAAPVAEAGTEALPAVEIETDSDPEPTPEPEPVAYEQAEDAYHAGRYAEAADLFERYADENPDNVWGLYMLGLSAWKAGELEDADLALADARELQPEHLKSLVNHARVLLELNRDNEAQAAIAAALTLAPQDLGAARVQARIHHRQGRLADADAAYRDVLRSSGDDAWALNNLGLILIEQERFDEAVAPLAKASQLASAACINNNLGVALERTGHYAAAALAYEAALEIDTDYARAEASLARVTGLPEDPALVRVDLAELAAGFEVDPAVPNTEVATAEVALAALPETEVTVEDAPVHPEESENDAGGNR